MPGALFLPALATSIAAQVQIMQQERSACGAALKYILPPHSTYSQLFGEPDADQDVSPDTADPELQDNGTAENDSNSDQQHMEEEEERKLSTRQWAESIAYDPEQLFTKLFYEDIVYLLRMDKLWLKRSPPTPLRLDHLPELGGAVRVKDEEGLQDQRLWSVQECVQVFMQRCGGIESEVWRVVGVWVRAGSGESE